MINFEDRLKGGILGLVVGDALGVPYEFSSRYEMFNSPATGMVGYGSHKQLSGTWSDDSSMTFCTMESLIDGYDLHDIADKFVQWRYESFWTPYGIVFDIGITTTKAIINYRNSLNPRKSGLKDERSNGNGSLMRILPFAFYLKDKPIEQRYDIISEVSSITHAHIRSVIACFIYNEFAIELILGKTKATAYQNTIEKVKQYLDQKNINDKEFKPFYRIFSGKIDSLKESYIQTSGYVVDSLEASIWCLLNTHNYKEAVLKAVNFGGDTDTTAAITGGIAGVYYGNGEIPENWLKQTARISDINYLVSKFYKSIE